MSSTLNDWSRVIRCPHCLPKEGGELFEKLLPSGYNHLLCVNEPSDSNEDAFRAHLKVKLSTEEEVEKWLQDLQYSSSWTWRVARTYPQSGRYNAFRVDLRCQYKTYSTGKMSRNTNCPATMFLVLKRQMEDRRSRSRDPHMPEGYYLQVKWRNEHNHPAASDDVTHKNHMSGATIIKLTQLYEKSSSLLDTIKYNLQEDQLYYVVNESLVDEDHQAAEDWESAQDPGTAGPGTSGEVPPECLDRQLDDIVALIKSKLREDTTFSAPVKSFVSSFHKLKTDYALKSALHCFGKTTHIASKICAPPRGFVVQRSPRVGRPPKSSRREHPYTKQGKPKGERHNLTVSVQENALVVQNING